MKHFTLLALSLLLPMSLMAAPHDRAKLESIATAFVDQLAHGEFETAREHFDKTMRMLSADRLGKIWNGLIPDAGGFVERAGTREESMGTFDIIYVTCRFERKSLDAKVVFDTAAQITGLFFVPTYTPPPYTDTSRFIEREVIVGSGEWAVHGTVSMPKGTGPFPALVLVHGSGPGDRDESIGPLRPFRDLAWGLASRGIAVLRYEKRTREHGMMFSNLKNGFTVREETVDDAVMAAELLRNTPAIDPSRVYVLGHSLGGMLAPRIGLSDTAIAGLIVMAGANEPLPPLMVRQYEYLFSLDGTISPEERKSIDAIKAFAKRIEKLRPSDSTSMEPLLGAPARYWLDLRSYDPLASARRYPHRMLFLQGERDYQVTMEQFARWRKALKGRIDVDFHSYPTLNHPFTSGTGKGTPDEYQIPANIPVEVIDDIARWVVR